MNRTQRVQTAEATVAVVERGSYVAPSGRAVEVGPAVRACLDATRFFTPDALEQLCKQVLASPSPNRATKFEVVNETTLVGIARASADRVPIAALNFASAKNPGGGFLSGSQAQEESLARSSALYASLQQAGEYYRRHRTSSSLLYSDAMILSPGCPIFRDDDGNLLERPQSATFITSAAPNAGAAATNRPEEVPAIPETFRRRAELVLALAAANDYRCLVLGAWGCGVFRNDPRLVAEVFAAHLRRGAWSGRFDRVIFSVLDSSPAQETFHAFRAAILD